MSYPLFHVVPLFFCKQEQIAEKERQKKEEAENRRQRDRQIEVPIASQMPAGGQMVPQDPGMAMAVPMSPQVPAMANIEGHRLGHQEDPGGFVQIGKS